MQVPLMDLARSTRALREELSAAVGEVIERSQFIGGPAVARFEKSLSAYFGGASATGVASGSEALVVALMALGVGAGDEVVTTPHTFYATAAAIRRVGSRIVFADVDPATMNLSPDAFARAVTPRTKAVIPVHLYGQPADLRELLQVARARNLAVVEDCAQAIGAVYAGRLVGLWGDVGCFSAYPAKNLGAFGDAGFVVTTSRDLGERIALLRDNGSPRKYEHPLFGYNARLDGIQAAVLDVKLRHIDRWNARRGEIAARYAEGLSGLPLELPAVAPDRTHVWHLYIVRTERRDALVAHLRGAGVGTQLYYPIPLHLQECFADLGHAAGDFPVTERIARENLALPLFPELTDAEQDYVIRTARAFFGR